MTIKVDETKTGEYDTILEAINTALSSLDDYHTELDSIMASGKWEGDAHEVCAAVFEVVKSYLNGLETDYTCLKAHVATLISNVDVFPDTSSSVKSLS